MSADDATCGQQQVTEADSTTTTTLSDNTNDDTIAWTPAAIQAWIHKRAQHRMAAEWDLADQIKQMLAACARVELLDQDDPLATTWVRVQQEAAPRTITWQRLDTIPTTTDDSCKAIQQQSLACFGACPIPLIINTVDTEYYRKRYNQTLAYLEGWMGQEEPHAANNAFCLEKCHLLNLQDYASVGAKGILMKGWKEVLIPWLLEEKEVYRKVNFVLVAEDDVRFPNGVSPHMLHHLCTKVFAANPTVHVLSLGHSWSELVVYNNNEEATTTRQHDLHQFLQRKSGSGIHATTLLALRYPDGVVALQQALEQVKRLQHLDQYLFHSTLYDNLNIALSDPPLAGWTDVAQSLTKSGSGHRRQGGGRLGRLPPPVLCTEIGWVQRCTTTTTRVLGNSSSTAAAAAAAAATTTRTTMGESNDVRPS